MTVALSGQRRYILVRATYASAAMASILIGRNPISRPEVGLFQNAGVGVLVSGAPSDGLGVLG